MVSRAELRYGGEWFDLFIAVFITLLVITIVGIATSGIICVYATVGILIVMVVVTMANQSAMKSSTRVRKDSWPKVYDIMVKCADNLGDKQPKLFIDNSRQVNAYASGILAPIIVLHRGLVDIMDEDELAFVIGHEMGHVKLYHTSLKTIFESGMARVPLILWIPFLIFRLLFLHGRMSRSMEHSADRAGLYACQDVRAAVSSLLKLHTGESTVPDKVVREAIVSKGREYGSSSWTSMFSTHPDKARRIKELVEYSRSHRIGWTMDDDA